MAAILALVPVAYSFPADTSTAFDVRVEMEGFIPILGGQEGTVVVTLGVITKGLAPDGQENPRASTEVETLQVVFNGATLPLSVDNIRPFFPKNTVTLSPAGRVLQNDAPDVRLPVRLPGLDPRRFPDITFLPIEFPAGGVEQGKSFSYTKAFGGSDVMYTVTPTSITDQSIELDIRLSQEYRVLEDEAANMVDRPDLAAFEVKTNVTGQGTATFSRQLKRVDRLEVTADAVSSVRDLKSGSVRNRSLKTKLSIRSTSAGR